VPTGPIIKEGFPLIGAMLIITVVLGYLGHYVIAIISFILALFFVNFFRNPKRVIPQDPDLILSPADGKIMDISDVYEDIYLHKECKKVTIFLSVFLSVKERIIYCSLLSRCRGRQDNHRSSIFAIFYLVVHK